MKVVIISIVMIFVSLLLASCNNGSREVVRIYSPDRGNCVTFLWWRHDSSRVYLFEGEDFSLINKSFAIFDKGNIVSELEVDVCWNNDNSVDINMPYAEIISQQLNPNFIRITTEEVTENGDDIVLFKFRNKGCASILLDAKKEFGDSAILVEYFPSTLPND